MKKKSVAPHYGSQRSLDIACRSDRRRILDKFKGAPEASLFRCECSRVPSLNHADPRLDSSPPTDHHTNIKNVLTGDFVQRGQLRLSVLNRPGIVTLAAFMSLLLPASVFAAHPLTTEDTGVQGLHNWQFELNTDRVTERETRIRNWSANATLAYGLSDALDLAFNAVWLRNQLSGCVTSSVMTPTNFTCVGDASVFLKWRIHEEGKLSFVVKPVLILPTGNSDKGLGGGRTRAGLIGVTTWGDDKLNVSANLGYTWNDNKAGERRDLWNTSAALMLRLADKLRGTVEAGVYSNSDPTSRKNPAYANVGLIYSPTDKLDFDIGYKRGLSDAESLYSLGVGVTVRW